MSPEGARKTGVLGRALLEAVGSLAEPALARGIVGEVLRRRGLVRIPEEIEEFRQLVEGPIRRQVERLLGEDAGACMVEQLAPVMEMATSDIRQRASGTPSDTGPRPVMREGVDAAKVARLRPGSTPLTEPATLVLMVSFDQVLCSELADRLRGVAQVRMVEMTMDLVASVEGKRATPVVIYDDIASPIGAETIEWLQSLMDVPLPVVLCGVDVDRHRVIELEAPGAAEWLRLESRAADVISKLVREALD
ncbi:MAG: hypothetical protein OXT09_28885 [Myxococcales bacterium]|nr:hypothetical protein [Myxococcales bacterium]